MRKVPRSIENSPENGKRYALTMTGVPMGAQS